MKSKLLLALVFLVVVILLGNQYTSSLEIDDQWFNSSWHFRVKMDVNTSDYDRTSWPVEYEMNFTQLFEQMNMTGTFDNESVRVFEYNDTGSILGEFPSQFDEADDYIASTNAVGTLIFILNGTTSQNTLRQFYVYFDRIETGAKTNKIYNTGMNYTWDGEHLVVNNTKTSVKIDTERGENTSGIWQVQYRDQDETNIFNPSGSSAKTREFTMLSDGAYNYSYNFSNNGSITMGPVRITFRQVGYETYWNDPQNVTNATRIVKEYYFYFNSTEDDSSNSSWILIKHNLTNINGTVIYRESKAGLLAFDALAAYSAGYKIDQNYTSDPGSWVRSTYTLGGSMTALINVNETGTSNFHADNYTDADRMGISLDNTTIQSGNSIVDVAAMVFGDTIDTPNIITIVRDRLLNPLNVSIHTPEGWWIEMDPRMYSEVGTSVIIFNRNESSLIWSNITYDPFNSTVYINATFNNGTGTGADDTTIVLYDDGTHGDNQSGDKTFFNYFNFTNISNIGEWNFTVYVYDGEGYYLNQTTMVFNITDVYNLTSYIWNDTGLPRVINATLDLTNFRRDIMIPGANISCSYDITTIPDQNVTDLGDGTYNVTFYTGDEYGLYYLNCTATKDGNTGQKAKEFTVESPQTKVAITMEPSVLEVSNMTYLHNYTLNLKASMNNTGNSSAYYTSITLVLPPELKSNTTFYDDVNTILVETEKARHFNISVLNNTPAGEYIINVTVNWTNLNGSLGYNESYVNITVYDNPDLNVPEDIVVDIIASGNYSVVDNFTVMSYGNYDLDNVTFNVTNPDNFTITFSPTNISSMTPGQTQGIEMNISVPSNQSTGIYNITINVSTNNGGYDPIILQIIVSGTNMSVETQPDYYISNNITAFMNETFSFVVNTSNTGNTTAFFTSINFSIPQNWTIINQSKWCGNVTRGNFCYDQFNVTVSNLTPPGNYTVNVTTNWEDIDIGLRSNTTSMVVQVVSNITLEIPEDIFTRTIWHGTEEIIGEFNIKSTGNDLVENVDFNLTGFENFTVEFNQSYPMNMSAGDFRSVAINVTIPSGYQNGTYNATINITTNNAGYKEINLSVTVPVDGNWTTNTTYCGHTQTPVEAVLCTVLISNTGNMPLNFTVSPASANHTNVSSTSLFISAVNSTLLRFYYNVSDVQGLQDWYANYTVDALQNYSNLTSVQIDVVLSRFIMAEIDIGLSPSIMEQKGSTMVYVNITSLSGASISEVILNVTIPNGTSYNTTMNQLYWFGCTGSGPGSMSCWYSSYPSTWGNATLKGNYTIAVSVNDSMGVNSTNTSILQVYTKYMATVYSPDCYQGDSQYIYYIARDAAETPLSGVNVNLSVYGPDNRSLYIFTGHEYTTDSGGEVTETLYIVPSQSPSGNYTIVSNGSYYDSDFGIWIDNQTNYTFSVGEDEELTAKVSVPQFVYINYMMPVSIIVLEGYNEPVDPDTINLTIYRTEGYNLDQWRSLDMGDLNKSSTGFYTYNEVLTSGVLSGSYLAVLRVTKGDKETFDVWPFRVSASGPYDVIITSIDSEVQQGGILNFDLYVENMGEVSNTDVNITYWISNGQTWYMTMFQANINAGENKTFSRTANIFSNQPVGNYYLNARVKFDPSTDAAVANSSFRVTAAGEAPPPGPGGGSSGDGASSGGPGGGGPSAVGEMSITDYESEVGVEIGVQKLVNVVLKNTGGTTLKNIKLGASGSAKDWVTVEPMLVDSLNIGSQTTFTLKIMVPRGESSGQFDVMVTAESDTASDSETFTLFVFTSRKDLIEFELVRLRAKLEELENEADQLESQGIDVSSVIKKLSEADNKIEIAEEYLSRQLYDASLDAVYTTWKLLKEAEDLLKDMGTGVQIPWWVIIIIILVIVMGIVAFFMNKMIRNMKTVLRGRMSEARKVAETVRGSGAEIDHLKTEKLKTQRMLDLIESQRKQGIMSKEAYNSLKKRSDEKMNELDKKIRKGLLK
jgi:uncharacterized membrane protein